MNIFVHYELVGLRFIVIVYSLLYATCLFVTTSPITQHQSQTQHINSHKTEVFQINTKFNKQGFQTKLSNESLRVFDIAAVVNGCIMILLPSQTFLVIPYQTLFIDPLTNK